SLAGSVSLGVHLSMVLVGWILWRYAHGYLGGILPVLLGGDVLLCASAPWGFRGTGDFMGFRSLVTFAASLSVLAGVGGFVWAGARDRPDAKHQRSIAVLLLCLLVGWWLAIPTLGNAAIGRRQAADTAANNAAAARAIAMVEEVRLRTAETPAREALPALLPE